MNAIPYTIMIILLLFSNSSQAQKHQNQEIIKTIYDALQKQNTSTKIIEELTSKIIHHDKTDYTKTNDAYHIKMVDVLKNHWHQVTFDNLDFQETEENTLIVTGKVSGRKATECEYITTTFKHVWILKNQEIIKLIEITN